MYILIQDLIFMAKSEIKNLTDSCGKIVNISEHAAMMVPFYYLPLIVLLVLLIKKPFIKMIRLVHQLGMELYSWLFSSL